MSKPQQAQFERVKEFEKAFKIRYGKDVEVYRALTLDDSGKLQTAVVHIVDNGEKYTLTEFLKDGATDYTLLNCVRDGKEKNYKFRSYLEGEILTADLIGEKIEKGKVK